MDYTTRPLTEQTWLRPPSERHRARFTASWSNTLELLDREVRALGGTNIVIGMDLTEAEIRNDGRPRAHARPATPAVEIAFTSKYGPLIYRCDEHAYPAWGDRQGSAWQANVRAVALTLEALRAVDRYGASAKGEQYRGYKAIGAGGGETSHMDQARARILLATYGDAEDGEDPTDPKVIRRAKASTHPDINRGDRHHWDLVEQAITVLT